MTVSIDTTNAKPSREDRRAYMAWHRENGTCYICERPVADGQAYHGATGVHWDCHAAEERKTEEAFAKVGGLKSRAREGTGKIAIQAKELAVKAIECVLRAELFDVAMWNQQGAYRGPRWDLDSWGLSFKFERDGHVFSGQASSLSTMTACVKVGAMKATETGDIAFDFSIDPQ